MKTARFTSVVEEAGEPEVYLLWSAPETDAKLQKLVKQHRVMTLSQPRAGTKKDHGQVGFSDVSSGQLLVFPKSLRRFDGLKIVGIDYHLLRQADSGHEEFKDEPKRTQQTPASRPPELAPGLEPASRLVPKKEVVQGVRANKTKRVAVKREESLPLNIRHEARAALKALDQGDTAAVSAALRRIIRSKQSAFRREG